MADAAIKYPLDKTLFDMRDKSIVTHDDKDVVAFSAAGNGSAWSADRDAATWWKSHVARSRTKATRRRHHRLGPFCASGAPLAPRRSRPT